MVAGFIEPTGGHVRLGGSDVTAAAAVEAQRRHGVPELRAVPAPDAWRRTSPSAWRCASCRSAEIAARVDGGAARWCGSTATATACRASFRRPAAARGAGPRARHPARRAAARRAALQPRRQAAPGGARRDPRAAAPARPHHRHGDARPGGGADHGRPAGGDERGLGAPGRQRSATSTSGRPTASWRVSSAAAPSSPARIEAPGRFRTDGGLCARLPTAAAPARPRWRCGPSASKSAPGAARGLDNSLPGTVEFVSYLGALIDIHVRLSPADRLVVQIANRDGGFAPEVGQPVHVGWPPVGRPGVQRVASATESAGGTSMSMTFMINRRDARSAARLRLPAGAACPARAQDNKRIVVGTWGGDYARLLAKNIETPLLAPEGLGRGAGRGQRPPRRAKMMAEKRLRARHLGRPGPVGRQHVRDERAGHRSSSIDYSKMPNAGEPDAGDEVSLRRRPHLFRQGRASTIRSSSTAPTSFADALDPKHGNKLGIIDIQYQYTMVAAALAVGRQGERFRARQGAAARLQEGRRAHLSDQRGLRPGAQDRGDRPAASCGRRAPCSGRTPASTSRRWRPSEGVPMYVSGFVMPKNAPNKAGAYAYLDAMLAASAQEGFAVDMGYNPTVTNATVRARPAEAHRLHRRGAEAPGRSRLRATWPRTTRPCRTGGTSRSRADPSMTDAALAARPRRRAATGRRPHGGDAGRRRRRSSSRSACWRRWPSCSATA